MKAYNVPLRGAIGRRDYKKKTPWLWSDSELYRPPLVGEVVLRSKVSVFLTGAATISSK
jgi:hypothetical protein